MFAPGPHDRRLDEFMNHWRGIPRRDGAAIPQLSDYFDRLNVEIQPWTIIVDVQPDALPIRLCGLQLAEVLGRDFTGADYTHAVRPEVRRHVLARDNACVTHPCGLRMTMKLRAATGRVFEDHMLILPAARTAKPGQPPALSLIRV